MGCLGVHFALTGDEVAKLRSFKSDGERLSHLQEVIEEHYFSAASEEKPFAESDKAWDAMHRTLADGRLTWDGGSYPLNHAVLAGELLYSGSDYIISLKNPDQVRDIAVALQRLDEEAFRAKYNAIKADEYSSPLTDEDFQYTWEWFQGVRELYQIAAAKNRYVLFTADQ